MIKEARETTTSDIAAMTVTSTSQHDTAAAVAPKTTGFDWRAYVSIARPDHWFKNVFMLAGVLLAIFCHVDFLNVMGISTLVIGFFATCIVASSNYVINEILDAPPDRHHPVKKKRPIPSGRVSLPLAYCEWILLAVIGLGLAATVNWPFFASAAMLLVMGLWLCRDSLTPG